jgi:septal ring factor EnvC (AmiA/AmiB activator)
MISRAGIAAIACISLLFLTRPLAAEDIQRQKTIAEIQTKLATARDEVERLLGAQTDIYDQLDKVDAELELSSRLLRELRKQTRIVTSEIQATTDTIGWLQQQSSSGNANYALHLRALYEYGQIAEPAFPPACLESINQDDAVYLYQRLISQDKKQLVELDLDITGHRQLLTSLMARKEELTILTRAQRTEERQARQAVRQREQLLAKVKGEQKQ